MGMTTIIPTASWSDCSIPISTLLTDARTRAVVPITSISCLPLVTFILVRSSQLLPTVGMPGSRYQRVFLQGADRHGPTAVLRSVAKMDHVRTGGTLLNQKFSPQALQGDQGLDKLVQLIRTYFRLDGHHIQFNVVDAATLRAAQDNPEQHRDLIVRVAGYSDYFCDLSRALQDEIIARTEYQGL